MVLGLLLAQCNRHLSCYHSIFVRFVLLPYFTSIPPAELHLYFTLVAGQVVPESPPCLRISN